MTLAIADNGHGWGVVATGRLEAGGFATEQAALDWWFDADRSWKAAKIGYPLAWIEEGAVYCAACAKEFWGTAENPGTRHDDLRDGTIEEFLYQDSTPLACSACDEWIVEPWCQSCGIGAADAGDRRFDETNGEPKFFCQGCMAAAVVCGCKASGDRYRAHKTGKRTYAVSNPNGSLEGVYARSVAETDRDAQPPDHHDEEYAEMDWRERNGEADG